ncbi:NAD(P)/FAD-dependent oxidoreductase [Mesorhizobium sp. M0976]|uniref:flavin-containing monooxygenase n=1 Tax=unclassified Mesorhizobium TaxID=325217 RepID=UPI003338B324
MADGRLDVLVIGAGQAGLATGYHLKRRSLDFYIIEQSTRVGDSWRKRYESLTLFTPRAFSALPGLPLADDPDGYPSREEFADYLQDYAARWRLPVATSVRVVELTRDGGDFLAMLSDGSTARSRSVVVATGGFQNPTRPAIAAGFDASVVQFDPESYRNPQSTPPGRVLVVGDGASGRDISAELAATNDTFLAVGKPRRLFPERILGRSVWWWLKKLGLMRARSGSLPGRIMRRADPFPDRGRSLPALRAASVCIVPRLVGAEGRIAALADGTRIEVDAVVWAIGYRDDFNWLRVPEAKDADNKILYADGVSPVSGLFFVGRSWQRSRASALVMGAGDDAAAIVQRISLTRSS